MKHVGHVVLDGIVNPTSWITYKATFYTAGTEVTSHLLPPDVSDSSTVGVNNDFQVLREAGQTLGGIKGV